MLLKSLRLLNFRQYEGTQRVEFSVDSDKNVTVILGDNTFGKTTLLQAFNWCFYGKVNLLNPEMLLNYDVADRMGNGETADVEVEIELVHNNRLYSLLRKQTYSKIGGNVRGDAPTKKMSFLKPDGQSEPINPGKVDEVIKSILPEDLSSYFFFDTERVASVSTRKDLSSSVKDLVGLSVLYNAMKHLGDKSHKRSVIGKLYDSMDQDGDERAAQALRSMQDATDRCDEIKKQLVECDSELEQLNAQKVQLDEKLRDNEGTKALQAKKEKLEADVSRDEAAVERTEGLLRSDFSDNSLRYFVGPLVKKAELLLKDAELDDKGIKDLTKPALEEILRRGVCVCGLKFSEHADAVEHIKAEMRYCPPESIGNAVKNFRGDIASLAGDVNRILDSMNDRKANVYTTSLRIDQAHDDIDSLSSKIEELPDLGRYEAARNDVKKQIRQKVNQRDALMREDGAQKSKAEKARKIYETFSVASGKNKQIILYIKYAEAIAQWLDETYSEKESAIRETLQERVNSIFEKMYHGKRRVVIDANYQVNLVTDLNGTSKITGESEGLNRVKNFAFIAGLVSIAKDKVVTKLGDQEYDLSSEPYPLVMDAPFSNTDETHIANISKELPMASEQVIMFVMNKDWRYAKPVLEGRVGASYVLSKISEQHSELKEA